MGNINNQGLETSPKEVLNVTMPQVTGHPTEMGGERSLGQRTGHECKDLGSFLVSYPEGAPISASLLCSPS